MAYNPTKTNNATSTPNLRPGVRTAAVHNAVNGALLSKIGKAAGTAALAVPRAIKKGAKKVGTYLKENERRNNAAAAEMDRRYPSGWAQSATNMTELNQIKKTIK